LAKITQNCTVGIGRFICIPNQKQSIATDTEIFESMGEHSPFEYSKQIIILNDKEKKK